MERDDVRERQQLVEGQLPGMDNLHAMGFRQLCHGLPDPTVTDDAERQSAEAATEHEGRRPEPLLAAANEPVPLDDSPREREHERERHLRRRLGQHVGCVGDDDATPRALLETDVVEADGVVRDDAKLRPGGIEQLGVDAIGEHGDEAVAARDPREQFARAGGSSSS